jgi:hypothetical protein
MNGLKDSILFKLLFSPDFSINSTQFLSKISADLFDCIDKLILNLIWKCKGTGIAKEIESKE